LSGLAVVTYDEEDRFHGCMVGILEQVKIEFIVSSTAGNGTPIGIS